MSAKFEKTNNFFNYFWTRIRFGWKQIVFGDNRKNATKNTFVSIFSIIFSLILSLFLVIIIYAKGSLFGGVFKTIFTAPFVGKFVESHAKDTISSISIFTMAALSFIFAQKAGLFNIGISGQMLFGGQLAVVAGFAMNHAGIATGLGQVLVIIIAMSGGALIAVVIDLLKTYLNVNEVISSILFNWTIFFLGTLFVREVVGKMGNIDSSGLNTESLPSNVSLMITNANGILNGSWLPLTIITIIVVPISIIILSLSTFGKKISVTGLSLSTSTYAGINVKSKQLIAMLISGMLAGLLGAMIYCGQTNQMFVTTAAKAIPTKGFDGISVGLISMSNPIAVLPISLFFAMVENANSAIQHDFLVDPVVVNLMFGVIVYGAAIISLMYYFKPWIWLRKLIDGKNNENNYHRYVNDQNKNIDDVKSTIYTINHYYHVNNNVVVTVEKIKKTILQAEPNFKININSDNFNESINELKIKYVNKLPKKSDNKHLSKLLNKLLELYKERKEFCELPNTVEVIKNNNIIPAKMEDINYVKYCITHLLNLALLNSKAIKNSFKKWIILSKLNNFDINMADKLLNRFYKDKLSELDNDYDTQKKLILNDYDTQKELILKNKDLKIIKSKIKELDEISKSKIKELDEICSLAIKQLKFEISYKKKLFKTQNGIKNELFENFNDYLENTHKIYKNELPKSTIKPSHGFKLKVTPYKNSMAEISTLAKQLTKKQIDLGKPYSLYENQITEIINYYTRTSYNLVKNEINDKFIQSIINKNINEFRKISGGDK